MARLESNQKTPRDRQNRFLVLLLVSAVLMSAAQDFGRLKEFSQTVLGLATSLHQTVYAAIPSAEERSCAIALAQNESSTGEFHWTGRIEPGQAIEIKGINGDIDAEPAVGSDLDVVAIKKARRSDPKDVNIQVVPHSRGVTICAVYPGEYSDQANTCEPDRAQSAPPNRSATNGVRNNDVQVHFSVRVPIGVDFVGRTINGEIKAMSLGGNVRSHTVNGSINISTSGYAEAKTVNGEINARLGSGNWTDALEFKTVNGGITVDLPADLSTKLEADTFNGNIDSDFPLTLPGKINRKHVSGTIGSGGRTLVLKTLNGSIRVKHAG